MNQQFVLKGDICYCTSLQSLATLRGGYLVCEDGRSVGVYTELPEKYRHYSLTDYGNALLLPGLTDLHVHAPQFTFRALGMDLELLDWLNTRTFPEEAKYHELAYAERAYSAFVNDVRKGPNTRAVIFATLHVPATMLLMEKLEKSGLRSMVGKVNMDRNSPPVLREESADTSLRDTCDWLSQAKVGFQHTSPILTPRFIPSCSDELMYGISSLQKQTGLPVQSHLSENQSECGWVQELCPNAKGYADAYRQYGQFGGDVPTIMAHCVWMKDEEIELMAQNTVYVAHCPQSNMNLSSGIAPVRRFLDQGVPVGLGSDVAGGCHTSIFRAISDAVQASKLHWRLQDQEAKPLSVTEAFFLATLGGGSFFGKVGSFEAGYDFDVIAVDDAALASAEPLSIEDRLARVIYLSDDRHIVGKYVTGEKLF